VLVPYSTNQEVACPFGLTVPVTVALVASTELTGPVIAAGATAAAAPPATAHRSVTATARTAVPRDLRMRVPFRVGGRHADTPLR
jgi:hypothetical protein